MDSTAPSQHPATPGPGHGSEGQAVPVADARRTTQELLVRYLDSVREAVLWKAEGLDEADLRRPLTPTGTNLLGLVKHLAACEYGYFGTSLGRPVPDLPTLREDADPMDDMVATEDESAAEVLQQYRDAIAASNAAVDDLGLDAVARVPWWGGQTSVERLLVHMTVETARHAGHMDIVRELVDGRVGLNPSNPNMPEADGQWWEQHLERVRTLAKRAEVGALDAD